MNRKNQREMMLRSFVAMYTWILESMMAYEIVGRSMTYFVLQWQFVFLGILVGASIFVLFFRGEWKPHMELRGMLKTLWFLLMILHLYFGIVYLSWGEISDIWFRWGLLLLIFLVHILEGFIFTSYKMRSWSISEEQENTVLFKRIAIVLLFGLLLFPFVFLFIHIYFLSGILFLCLGWFFFFLVKSEKRHGFLSILQMGFSLLCFAGFVYFAFFSDQNDVKEEKDWFYSSRVEKLLDSKHKQMYHPLSSIQFIPKQYLSLFYMDDMPYTYIPDILGLSTDTAAQEGIQRNPYMQFFENPDLSHILILGDKTTYLMHLANEKNPNAYVYTVEENRYLLDRIQNELSNQLTGVYHNRYNLFYHSSIRSYSASEKLDRNYDLIVLNAPEDIANSDYLSYHYLNYTQEAFQSYLRLLRDNENRFLFSLPLEYGLDFSQYILHTFLKAVSKEKKLQSPDQFFLYVYENTLYVLFSPQGISQEAKTAFLDARVGYEQTREEKITQQNFTRYLENSLEGNLFVDHQSVLKDFSPQRLYYLFSKNQEEQKTLYFQEKDLFYQVGKVIFVVSLLFLALFYFFWLKKRYMLHHHLYFHKLIHPLLFILYGLMSGALGFQLYSFWVAIFPYQKIIFFSFLFLMLLGHLFWVFLFQKVRNRAKFYQYVFFLWTVYAFLEQWWQKDLYHILLLQPLVNRFLWAGLLVTPVVSFLFIPFFSFFFSLIQQEQDQKPLVFTLWLMGSFCIELFVSAIGVELFGGVISSYLIYLGIPTVFFLYFFLYLRKKRLYFV